MTLAKYINEKKIERYKGFVIINGITYANNEDKAKEVGYKELRIDEQPTYDTETEYLDYYYQDGDVITQKWEVKPIEVEDDIE